MATDCAVYQATAGRSPGLTIIDHLDFFDHVVPVGPLRRVVSKKDRPGATLHNGAEGLAGPLAL